jgi:hypothetical protein
MVRCTFPAVSLLVRELQLNAKWMENEKMDGKENVKKKKKIRPCKIPKIKK